MEAPNRIGLVGLGLLGSAIADRLITQGRHVHGFDIAPDRMAEFSKTGEPAAGPQAIFDNSDVVLLSLPTSDVCRSMLQSITTRPEQLIIDTTTGEPEQMIALGEHLRKYRTDYAEATVAGSSNQMRKGQATIFLGCSGQTTPLARSITELLSPKVFNLGDVGSASRFKLVHNLVLGLHRAVLAEGLTFASALGFDAGESLEILKQTPASSTVMETKGGKMVESNFDTQARLSQHLKDVRLILTQAKQHDIETPLSDLHRSLLEKCEEMGFGAADNSAIIEAFRSR